MRGGRGEWMKWGQGRRGTEEAKEGEGEAGAGERGGGGKEAGSPKAGSSEKVRVFFFSLLLSA